jgi:hypothetical protein
VVKTAAAEMASIMQPIKIATSASLTSITIIQHGSSQLWAMFQTPNNHPQQNHHLQMAAATIAAAASVMATKA